MYWKNKIKIVILLFIVFGCAPSLKNINEKEIYLKRSQIIEETLRNNLGEYGFFIKKGKLNINNGNEETVLLFTMKYLPQDNYLISLKSVTGIEAMRVKLTKDTIIVNDRINKEILYGKSEAFERVAGIPVELLKIAVGDLCGHNIKFDENYDIKNNTLNVFSNLRNINIVSTINCNINKVKRVVIYSNEQDDKLYIDYSGFKGGNYIMPGTINIQNEKGDIKISIKVKKIIIPWQGELEFIPGNGYTKKNL